VILGSCLWLCLWLLLLLLFVVVTDADADDVDASLMHVRVLVFSSPTSS
jgi:hypothetical protein